MVFPAYAGMIPGETTHAEKVCSVPRIRGDDPRRRSTRPEACCVFPAYAGMIPVVSTGVGGANGVPRIRGDDPAASFPMAALVMCSPHTRG